MWDCALVRQRNLARTPTSRGELSTASIARHTISTGRSKNSTSVMPRERGLLGEGLRRWRSDCGKGNHFAFLHFVSLGGPSPGPCSTVSLLSTTAGTMLGPPSRSLKEEVTISSFILSDHDPA